ncbi:hypothetical protein HWV62_43860 [Athelia sp. TMB]|nr:hypothetical protein HWV62_43860 [Athelia sp. TMB]
MALLWLTWVILASYFFTLLVSAVARTKRGERTWTVSVKHARFFDPRSRHRTGAAPIDIVTLQHFQWSSIVAPHPSIEASPTQMPSANVV